MAFIAYPSLSPSSTSSLRRRHIRKSPTTTTTTKNDDIHRRRQSPRPRVAVCMSSGAYGGNNNNDDDDMNGSSSSPPPPPPPYGDDSNSGLNGSSSYAADAETAAPTVVDAVARAVPLDELKAELYAAAACMNRGFAVTPSLTGDIRGLIEQLERSNPNPAPPGGGDDAAALRRWRMLLGGKWRLVYTDALDVLSLGLLSPVALVNQVYQTIGTFVPYSSSSSSSSAGMQMEAEEEEEVIVDVANIVELQPFTAAVGNMLSVLPGRTLTNLVVKANGRQRLLRPGAQQQQQQERQENKQRSASIVELRFESVRIQPESFLGFRIGQDRLPAPALPLDAMSPVGLLDTTYLDEDVRISRARAGSAGAGALASGVENVFVFIREAE